MLAIKRRKEKLSEINIREGSKHCVLLLGACTCYTTGITDYVKPDFCVCHKKQEHMLSVALEGCVTKFICIHDMSSYLCSRNRKKGFCPTKTSLEFWQSMTHSFSLRQPRCEFRAVHVVHPLAYVSFCVFIVTTLEL